jgi:hypothetical protein
MLTSPCQSDKDTLCSDVEILDVEYLSEEVVAERTRRLELDAYLRTLQAMYAAGPLTWKKEEVLTNLRLLLNISIDEHLKGIKNLVSSGRSF